MVHLVTKRKETKKKKKNQVSNPDGTQLYIKWSDITDREDIKTT